MFCWKSNKPHHHTRFNTAFPCHCIGVTSLLLRCERLMLASRRAISQCRAVFPAAPSVRCRHVATTRRTSAKSLRNKCCHRVAMVRLFAQHIIGGNFRNTFSRLHPTQCNLYLPCSHSNPAGACGQRRRSVMWKYIMRLQISNVWHILITCPQPSCRPCGERHSRPLRVLRGTILALTFFETIAQ